jgi:hypothetical protein
LRKLWSGMALSLLLAVTGCGGDDSEETASTTPPTTSAEAPTPTFSGPGSGQFCELVKTYNDRVSGLSRATTTPAQLRQLATELGSAIQQAVAVAPAEIKTDVTLVAAAATDYLAGLQRAGYDLGKVPPDSLRRFQAPDVQAATQRLTVYGQTVCGTG